MHRHYARVALLVFLALMPASARHAAATPPPTIWPGYGVYFEKADDADPTQAANQDAIVAGVKLTRGTIRGLYNAALEGSYTSVSPKDTEWAYGTTANYASLTYAPWTTWVGGNPLATIGAPAVLHLVAENIYIDIQFDSWTAISGGGFSYHRGQDIATPAATTTWGRIKTLYR